MKAIRVYEAGGPEVMKFDDCPDPIPGPGEVVIQIKAAGVNPVDTYIRSGMTGPMDYPYTPGMDGAGVVQAVGKGVSHVKQGDRVYCAGSLSGTYAELCLCRQTRVFPLPDNLSFVQGAAIGVPYGTAYSALFQHAHVRFGETVLVHGASGGVGTASVQLSRMAGLTVIGTVGSEKGRKLVLDEEAHHVLDHTQEGYLQQVMDITQGRGVDVILEMLANVNLGNDLTVLAPKGRVVVIGSRGDVTITPREIMRRNASILGMLLLTLTDDEAQDIHSHLRPGLESGVLKPVIGKQLPLSDAPQSHSDVMKPGAYGKIVLIP